MRDVIRVTGIAFVIVVLSTIGFAQGAKVDLTGNLALHCRDICRILERLPSP